MKKYLFSIFIIMSKLAFAAPFATWTNTELTLTNGLVQRIIKLPATEGNFITSSYKPVNGEFKYFSAKITDFQFEADGISYSGRSNWRMVNIQRISDKNQGDGAAVTLQSIDKKLGACRTSFFENSVFFAF